MLSKLSTEILEAPFGVLNLTRDHAAVYLVLLELGAGPAGSIAKMSRLPRSTTYLLLDELKKSGLVNEIEGEKKKYFAPVSPERLKDLLDEKAREVRRTDLDLRTNFAVVETLFENHRSSFPKVHFYEGENGLKTVYLDSLWASEILTIAQGDGEMFDPEAAPGFVKEFIREVTEREILVREIIEETPPALEYAKRYKTKTHEIVMMPKASRGVSSHTVKHIYADKIAYIFHEHLTAVVIESDALAASERSLFELIWMQVKGFQSARVM